VVSYFVGHAASVVGDFHNNVVARRQPGMGLAIVGVDGCITGFQNDVADAINGIPGVHAQVGGELIQLGWIKFDRPKIGTRNPLQHICNGLVQIQHLRDNGLTSRECQKLLSQVCRSF